ncbi:MAG: diacylglycerol kinase family protein [Bacteroidales bacterium]|nr:diacylglycerol kinase family protein [Bacteroidales bacterium]
MGNDRFSWKKRALSFRYAAKGISILIKNEHNAWIHLVVFTFVIIAGFSFKISSFEWALIAIVSGMVLLSEAFNTAIEYLCNRISPEQNETIGKVKDIAAGAVLIAAIFAAIVGLIIFVPYLLKL